MHIFWKYLYTFLLLVLAVLIITIFQIPDSNLHIIACDVGQGDAVLVTHKNIQILIDGGPSNKVIDCLSRHVPFYDREIELVISTHPQKDHYFGLIEVFKRYKVDNLLYNGTDVSTQEVGLLYRQAQGQKTQMITPYSGQVLRVGLMLLDILGPAGKSEILNSKSETTNSNNDGVVTLLKYDQFKALFMADVEGSISDELSTLSEIERVEYIKVNHHGSKNGLTENLLKAAMPKVAVISVGKNNTYGHPTQETLDILQKSNVLTYRTDELGDVEIITDGKRFWIKK